MASRSCEWTNSRAGSAKRHLTAARKLAYNEETGLFVVIRKKEGRDYEVGIFGHVNAEEMRDAMLGAVLALGKIAEKGSTMGLVVAEE